MSESVLFSAGHGFFDFHIDEGTFNRSLYYNLLLQRELVAPDHYFLQGGYILKHLHSRSAGDSWLETALKNGFLVPYLREGISDFHEALKRYSSIGSIGFRPFASQIADRLNRKMATKRSWDPDANSSQFGKIFESLFSNPFIILPKSVDPWDYLGFLDRSKTWRQQDIQYAKENANIPGTLPMSLLMRSSFQRIFGNNGVKADSVRTLIYEMKARDFSSQNILDIIIFYTLAGECYNRSLADTILVNHNSPKQTGYLSALDASNMFPDLDTSNSGVPNRIYEFEETVSLPRFSTLMKTSGDVLLQIRCHPSADRYFDSLAYWKEAPHRQERQVELISSLKSYTDNINDIVGRSAPKLKLFPSFIPSVGRISNAVLKILSVAPFLMASPEVTVPFGVCSVVWFSLKAVTEAMHQPEKNMISFDASQDGTILFPDVTFLRKE